MNVHSTWIDAPIVNTATSEATIEKGRMTFVVHGLLEIIVSDNGAVFTNQGFEDLHVHWYK